MENLNSIKEEILQKIESAESDDTVEEIRISELGKREGFQNSLEN